MDTKQNEQAAAQQQTDVELLENKTLDSMQKWYGQQIQLAKSSAQLAKLKADIAKSRLEETLAFLKIAELTAPPSDQPVGNTGDTQKTESGIIRSLQPVT